MYNSAKYTRILSFLIVSFAVEFGNNYESAQQGTIASEGSKSRVLEKETYYDASVDPPTNIVSVLVNTDRFGRECFL